MQEKQRGHLKVENGYYSIVINTEVQGQKKWPQWSIGLRTKGNKTFAQQLLDIVCRNFITQETMEDYKQERQRIQKVLYDALLEEKLFERVSPLMKKRLLKYQETKETGEIPVSKRHQISKETSRIDLPLFREEKQKMPIDGTNPMPISSDFSSWMMNQQQFVHLENQERCYYVYRGPDLDDFKITRETEFHVFLEIYMNYIYRLEAKPNTFEKAYGALRYRDCAYFQAMHIQLHEVNSMVLEFYYDQMIKGYSIQGKKYQALKTTSIGQHHYYIKRALTFAVKVGLIPNNPADHVKLPNKKVRPIKETYTIEELQQLFQALRGKTCEYVVIMAAYYGMRRSEILGLQWTDINFKKKYIRVHRGVHYTRVGKQMQLYVEEYPKTDNSIRTLPLFPAIEKMFLKIQNDIARNRHLFKDKYSLEYKEFVFVDRLGQLRKPETVSRCFKQIVINHHLRYISLHNLRHTVGTLLSEENVNLEKIRMWLGHSDIQTTSRYYLHANYQTQLDTAKVLENILPDFTENFEHETDCMPFDSEWHCECNLDKKDRNRYSVSIPEPIKNHP